MRKIGEKAPGALYVGRQNARHVFNLSFLVQTQDGKVSPEDIKALLRELSPARQAVDERLFSSSIQPLPFLGSKYRDLVLENRIGEIDSCIEYLADHNMLLITGLAGIGKSAIARLLAEFRYDDTPTPFWYDFHKNTPDPSSDILEKLAAYLQRPAIGQFLREGRAPGQAELDQLIHALNEETRYWLIFNNLEKALDQEFMFARPPAGDVGLSQLFETLATGRHKATTISTSREEPRLDSGRPLASDPAQPNRVLGLATEHGIKLLNDNWLRQIDEDLLEPMAAGVDGHPLALTFLIEIVKMEGGPEGILKDLETWRTGNLETLTKAKNLFDRLVGDERELLSYLSVYREPLDRSAFEFMCDSGTRPKAHLNTLFDKALIRIEKGLYSLHPLIINFADEDFDVRHEAEQKAAERYLSLSVSDQAKSRNDVEPLLSALGYLINAKNHEVAGKLLFDSGLSSKLELWGNFSLLVDIYTKLLAFKPLIDKRRLAVFLGKLGSAWAKLSETSKAIECYEEALAIAREIGDHRGEAIYLANLGDAWTDLGHVKAARDYLHEAHRIFLEIEDPRALQVAGAIEKLASGREKEV